MDRDRMSALGANLHDVDWGRVEKVEGSWNYYQGNPVIRSPEEIARYLRENQVTIIGERVPAPILTFKELTAPEGVMRAFDAAGFTSPTPIQAMAWPILLSSRDLVGIAKTGSGKTLAFICPAIMHIAAQPPLKLGDGPICLVLAPTRELAMQIDEETKKVCSRLQTIRSTCIYGGAPKHSQTRDLRAGVHICIATPGRLIDMLEARATNLLRVTYLVLDEADRMLDMGFEPQIRKICSQIRTDRQTMMFSATWPEEIRALAGSFQREFIRIHIGSIDLMANADVRQNLMVVNDWEKTAKTLELFKSVIGQRRVLIFVKTKKTCDDLQHELHRAGYNATAIHGDKQQSQREYVLSKFRAENNCVLVATDVAARGLDIKDLDVVINFDFPSAIEDYVHRIGRTGRAGKTGDAYSFLSQEPAKIIRDLKALLRKAGQAVPPQLDEIEQANYSEFKPRSRGPMGSGGPPRSFGGTAYGAVPRVLPPMGYSANTDYNNGGNRDGGGYGGGGGGGDRDYNNRDRDAGAKRERSRSPDDRYYRRRSDSRDRDRRRY